MPNKPFKTCRVDLRLTPLERDFLQALAAKNQMSVSEYLRFIIHREAKRLQ